MDLTEKKIGSQKVFDGKLLQVFLDKVSLPNGNEGTREIVRHMGGACILAIDEELCVTFVRQFRYAYDKVLLEIPAGKLEKGEDPKKAAERELQEETGLVAKELISLGEMYPSSGYTDEVIYMYLALGAEQQEQNLDNDEFIEVEKMSLNDAVSKVLNGEIKDAKTQISLLKAYVMLDQLSKQQ